MKYPHIAFVFLLWTTLHFAQNYQLTNYGINQGVPHSKITALAQDDLGNLWLATNGGGLSKFDGLEFEIIDENDGLISDYTNCIFVDSNEIYIGTRDGLSVKNGLEIFNYKSSNINSIITLGKNIYLATNKGFRLLNENEISLVKLNPDLDASIVYDAVVVDAILWLATNRGLWKIASFGAASQKITQVFETSVETIVYDQNTLYFSTNSNGVFKLETDKEKANLIAALRGIQTLFIDTETKDLWVGVAEKRLYRLSESTNYRKKEVEFNASLDRPFLTYQIFEDRNHIKWLASNQGLFKLTTNGFRHFMPSESITAVLRYQDMMLSATSRGRLVAIDSGKVKAIDGVHDNIYSLGQLDRTHVLAGTDEALLVLDTLKVVDTILGIPDVQKINVKALKVWVASATSGIYRFQYDTTKQNVDSLVHFGTSDGIYDLAISDMAIDANDRLWYITKGHMLGYIEKDIVHHLGVVLSHNASINTITIGEGYIYLGTSGKGVWYAPLGDMPQFRLLSGSKLASNSVYQLLYTNSNSMWVGTPIGIELLQLNEGGTRIIDQQFYGRNEGFIGVETMPNAIDMDAQGNVWFGTIRGLTAFEPAQNFLDEGKPELHFTKVEVAYNSIDTLDYSLDVDKRILNLSPEQQHLAFGFESIDLHQPNALLYRWKLNTAAWSSWSANKEVVFANLNSGQYTFKAQAKAANGKISNTIALAFYIETALTNTIKFKLSLLIASILMILFVFWNYLRKLRKKNSQERQKLAMENQLLVLEQKALRLQMNPHFIFNVLNGIKALGATDTVKMNKTIQKFAGLLRATLTNARHETITLEEEISSLNYYLALEQLMVQKPFSYKIIVDKDLDKHETLLPPMLLQPFVENAIQHGISKVKHKGKLSINFDRKGEYLHCSIEDNGVGIKQSIKMKSKSSHQSLALQVTKERIEALYGEASFAMQELIDEKGKVQGTKVMVILPYLTDF